MMFTHVCSMRSSFKKLQQQQKIEQLPVQKTSRRKHSENEHFDALCTVVAPTRCQSKF